MQLAMRYHALACDYDGTLARHGAVDDATTAALRCLRESGRRVILVTGKDEALAEAARKVEQMTNASPKETRRLLREQIEKRYSAPA